MLQLPALGFLPVAHPLMSRTVEVVRQQLVHSGKTQEAEALLQRLLGLANDVGFYAEEAVPGTGEALGNFPQAFTHMALVSSCAQLSAARSFRLPRPGAYDFADFALTYHLGRRSMLMSRFSGEAVQ